MSIAYRERVFLEIQRYPDRCNECPMFCQVPYQCHNEHGLEGQCRLGYMTGSDMRDFFGHYLFEKCNIRNNPSVTLMEAT